MNKTGKTGVKAAPKLSEVNVKDTFTSHIDNKKIFYIFVDTLSLYIFTMLKSIVYNLFCRDGIYFDKILVSEYKLYKKHIFIDYVDVADICQIFTNVNTLPDVFTNGTNDTILKFLKEIGTY